MKSITELENINQCPELKKIAENIMNEIFTKSQENLVTEIKWGDDKYSGHNRRPTKITDQGIILQSGIPPYWETPTRLAFEYKAAHSFWVEVGTPPHPIDPERLEGWILRKLDVPKDEIKQVSYMIAKKIATVGIEPHPYLRPAINEVSTKYNIKVIITPN